MNTTEQLGLKESGRRFSKAKLLGLLGILVVAALFFSFRAELPSVLSPSSQAVLLEQLSPYRTEFRPGEISVYVLNTGPVEAEVAAVQVGGSHPFSTWDFVIEPGNVIPRLSTATIRIPYNWVEGEPYAIKIITSSGASFVAEVEAAVPALASTKDILPTAIILGTYVGVVPVFLGIAPFPILRRLNTNWMVFLAALAAGVLAFLFVDTVSEAVEIAQRLPLSLGPPMLIGGFAAGVLGLVAFGRLTIGSRETNPGGGVASLYLAYMIAAAIGLHNLGEGLAIGAAQTAGKLAFAALLAIGFALHNTTEGLAIVAPVVREKVPRIPAHLALMGFIAGAPTIGGTWLSLTFFSDAINTLFFAIAAGAILYVVAEIIVEIASMRSASNSPWLYSGLLTGIFVMYVTAVALTVLVGEI